MFEKKLRIKNFADAYWAEVISNNAPLYLASCISRYRRIHISVHYLAEKRNESGLYYCELIARKNDGNEEIVCNSHPDGMQAILGVLSRFYRQNKRSLQFAKYRALGLATAD